MEILGYLGALLVGFSLGVLGAGGSILAVPVLIYLFKIEPLHATTYSFFIVGCTAFIGAVQNIRKGAVKVMPALYFAVSGMISIYMIRQFVMEMIPEVIISFNGMIITKDIFIFVFFAIVMAVAGISMIRSSNINEHLQKDTSDLSYLYLIMLGFGIGIVIAFAGVGGGFLITPALLLFARLPIKKAIGTSLCIISLNSFVGFFSSLQLHDDINWKFLFLFVALTATGIVLGAYLAKRIESKKLKKIFGWFVLMMSIFIILNELYLTR